MNITIQELVEVAKLIKNEEHIKIDIADTSITIRAKCDAGDKLLKPIFVGTTNSKEQKITQLGIYRVGELKIWVVKE